MTQTRAAGHHVISPANVFNALLNSSWGSYLARSHKLPNLNYIVDAEAALCRVQLSVAAKSLLWLGTLS